MNTFEIGQEVKVNSPGHRKDGRTGTVTSGPGMFMGTWTVRFDGHDYGFFPSELEASK